MRKDKRWCYLGVVVSRVGRVPSAGSTKPGASARVVAGRLTSRYTPFLEALARCLVMVPGTRARGGGDGGGGMVE